MKTTAFLLVLLITASCATKAPATAIQTEDKIAPATSQATNTSIPTATPEVVTPTPDPLPADDTALFYMIQRGDTLETVAAKFGLTKDLLAAMNDPEMVRRFRPETKLALYPREQILARIYSEPGKKVVVVIGEQRAYAVDGATQVRDPFVISTGVAWHPSPVGKFAIITKLVSMVMQGPKDNGGHYYLPNVPYDMNFHSVFYLHGAPWNKSLGRPYSGGCINFSVEDAHWLYDWTDPKPVGKITYATKDNPGTTVWVIP